MHLFFHWREVCTHLDSMHAIAILQLQNDQWILCCSAVNYPKCRISLFIYAYWYCLHMNIACFHPSTKGFFGSALWYSHTEFYLAIELFSSIVIFYLFFKLSFMKNNWLMVNFMIFFYFYIIWTVFDVTLDYWLLKPLPHVLRLPPLACWFIIYAIMSRQADTSCFWEAFWTGDC